MNASDIINGLIKAGVAVKDAIAKSQAGGKADYAKALQAILADPNLAKTVRDFMAAIHPNDVASAIGEVDNKQQALLKGKAIADLAPEDLLKYSDLADARLVLATQQLKTALTPSVVEWLVDDALPTLVDIAPVVIPLLL